MPQHPRHATSRRHVVVRPVHGVRVRGSGFGEEEVDCRDDGVGAEELCRLEGEVALVGEEELDLREGVVAEVLCGFGRQGQLWWGEDRTGKRDWN